MQVMVLPTSEFIIIQGVTKKTEDFRASIKLHHPILHHHLSINNVLVNAKPITKYLPSRRVSNKINYHIH